MTGGGTVATMTTSHGSFAGPPGDDGRLASYPYGTGGPYPRPEVRLRPLRAALAPVGATLVGALCALVTGLGLLVLVALLSEVPTQGSAEDVVGVLFLSLLVMLVVWWPVYALVVALLSRRVLASGHRLAAVLVAVLAPVVWLLPALLTAGVPASASEGLLSDVAATSWGLLCLGAGPGAFAWAQTRPGATLRRALVAAAAALAVLSVVAAVGLLVTS